MKTALLLALPLTLAATALAHDGEHTHSPDGYYVTVDDSTGEARGLVELREVDGELKGFLRGTFAEGEDMSGTCITCSDALLDQPLYGLPFIWDLEFDKPGRYKGGRIMDPESGKTYKSKVKFADDFDTLELRGYLGSPILGRTQNWRRATPAELDRINANLAGSGLGPLDTLPIN